MNKNLKNVLLFIGIPIAFIIAVLSVSYLSKNTVETKYYEIVEMVKENKISEFSLNLHSGQLIYTKRDDGKSYRYTVADPSIFYYDVKDKLSEINEQNSGTDKIIKYDYKSGGETAWIMNLLPTLITVGVMVIFWVFIMKRMNASMGTDKTMGFGKAKVRKDDGRRKTTFADVAGADEEKEEMAEIVDFLKDPKKYNELGAKIPKGVLLVGPPGTGKTLLARAVAGEANVPFFSISGSDFVELYVGVGAARVRDLFEQAKKSKPCIIFIDEIDAVGRKRGAGMGGGHDEREQTLNQLLVEMDGFGVNEGIIMMAATNRPDILDPAILRAGRFDRQVVVDVPDVMGREEILKVHSRKKPLADDVDLKKIAKVTIGYTGADLENLMNEAAIFAARRNKKQIDSEDIEDANLKVMMGAEKKSRVITEKEKRLTAYHEAGHAVLSSLIDSKQKVHRISIIPRGRAGGFTMHRPEEDLQYSSKKEMLDEIVMLLGGRIAEELVLEDISTGASNDLKRATEIARNMVTRYGMSANIGPVCYDNNEEVFIGRDFGHSRAYSEKTAADIDGEVKAILEERYAKGKELLNSNLQILHNVAKALLERETIDAAEFDEIINKG